jgi:hypothetical protein
VAMAIRNADGDVDVDAPDADADAGQRWLWRKCDDMPMRDGEFEATVADYGGSVQ